MGQAMKVISVSHSRSVYRAESGRRKIEEERSEENSVSRMRASASLAAENLVKAVNSIPAYIERSTHFFVVCPEVEHLDLPGVVCNLSSWFDRGWCRVEMNSLLLARKRKLTPPILVQSSEGERRRARWSALI